MHIGIRAVPGALVLLAGCGFDGTWMQTPERLSADVLPYASSPVIVGVEFDDGSKRTAAPGSDNWPITWAQNGHMYTTWGDGGGFGGTDSVGRVSLGIARVEGGKRSYTGHNIAGGVDAPNPAPFPGKSEGILAIGNTLYLWRNGDGSSTAAFRFSRLYRSTDLGAHWSQAGVEFSRSSGDFTGDDEGFFSPAFCQFGRGYTGARDRYVYIYAPEIIDRSTWDVQKPGRIALMRVPASEIDDEGAYEFFAGLAGGAPIWTHNIRDRAPVWEDTVNGAHRLAVSYNPGLRRYLLTTMTQDRSGRIAMFAAPEPWGPWTTVLVERSTQRWGTKVVIFSFVNKWLSDDGRDFVLVHTGCCGDNDHWSSIEGRFSVSQLPTDPTPVEPDPVEPDPVAPDPVAPDPVEPSPAEPDPIEPSPVEPRPADPEPTVPEPAVPTDQLDFTPGCSGDVCLGAQGQSCDRVCADHGRSCDPSFAGLDTCDAFSAFGTCTGGCGSSTNPWYPAYKASEGECRLGVGTTTCAAYNGSKQRLCRCLGESPSCGDGSCNGGESCITCPQDCGACAACGDGSCAGGESCSTCPEDCGACASCGDFAPCCSGDVCLGTQGQSCDQVCAQHGGTCDPSFAGLDTCAAFSDFGSCTGGCGSSTNPWYPAYKASEDVCRLGAGATTCAASNGTKQRLCRCLGL